MSPTEDAATGSGIDPRRLLIFREVARRGSLSAAAAALGWTQPAVGQHVQRLERAVGLPLARRSTRGVTLTEAGAALLSHADAVAARLTAADEEMSALRTMRAGRLRIAAFPSASATIVPPALARLAEVAPGLDVRLTEHEPPEARAAVLAGDVDIAVLFDHPDDGSSDAHPDLIGHALMDDPVFAVLPATHALAEQGRCNLAELAGERWVAGCERCRGHLLALAAQAGFEPDVRHATDDYVVVQNLVAAGLAVALLPGLALAASKDPRVVAVRLAGDPHRRVTLVRHRESVDVPAVRAGVHALTADALPGGQESHFPAL
ncbi:LysR family transcriptional regulator [Pseudonocardia sp. TRM90224]|uniref:LysR family transcriptional regulator n=1 Tax=Pseudonocardia sp. TRM90224 TaxID=2812678 RepID=UPI001E52D79C|nr:LysR family transcriptional regulator [Pseudonocardia sp. TRM90224]